MSEFPKWRYHATKQAMIVDDADAEEALGLGWFDTPAEALAASVAEKHEDEYDDNDKAAAEAYRKELLAKAKAMGIEIYHTSGVEKIQAAIAAHSNT